MTELKRYHNAGDLGMEEHPSGNWVKYETAKRLKQERDRLVAAIIIAEECGEPEKTSLYDEEGVEGWRWLHPDGREWTEIGDWEAMPLHPEVESAMSELNKQSIKE